MSFLPGPRYSGLFGATLNPNGFATGVRPRSPFGSPDEPGDVAGPMGAFRRPSYMTATNMTPSVDPLESMAAGFTQVRGINPPVTKRPGVNWGGIAADFVAGLAGREGPYGAMLEARRQSEEAARRQEAQRQAQREDFLFQADYNRKNPMPQAPDAFERSLLASGIQPGTPRWAQEHSKRLLNFTDPTVNVQLPNNQIYVGPRSGLERALSGAQGGDFAPAGETYTDPDDGKVYRSRGGPRSNQNTWEPVGGAGSNTSGGFPVKGNFDAWSNAIIQQETGGRYGLLNMEGSGAMGLGQVMPDTGKALAKRVGLPWRPDLMQADTPEARAYQNKITRAALQEAWQYGNGDPSLAAAYYFAGPDKRGWGPKTRRYRESILRRMGGK